jgi:CDP-diglyceride synthetase
MADDRDGSGEEGDVSSEVPAGFEAEPPSYRSGRVRIIGAEPAGNAVHEVTGPVVEENPDMPHWNDAPTGQVPAILDRGNGDEQALAPPSWREEDSDWAAHEELFEPSMLSDEVPPVGSMMNNNNDIVDMERQPWLFDTGDLADDDTLVIEPDRPPEPPAPRVAPAAPYGAAPPATAYPGSNPFGSAPFGPGSAASEPAGSSPFESAPFGTGSGSGSGSGSGGHAPPAHAPAGHAPARPSPVRPAPTTSVPVVSIPTGLLDTDTETEFADIRLEPPVPPKPRVRAPRTTRLNEESPNANVNVGGTGGRNMQLAWGSGILLGVAALLCAKFGSVSSMVIITIVVLFAAAEAFAAFRIARYHPATLLGLVAILSLMIETYNKGVAALPLVLVMLVAASFVWYLARVEPAADPVAGLSSTIFVVAWVGGLGSFGALLLNPTLFPHRHGVAFLLAAVIVTVAADVVSLLVGSGFGRHPLAPSISPNKTWEGFLGGAVAAVLVAVVVVHFIHPWTISKALVLGVVVAVVAPIGDLSQSMIKRHLGVKDMGRLMPGHGGILDRVDGLLFVLPATYFVVKAFHLG